jgi:hypothetical protein
MARFLYVSIPVILKFTPLITAGRTFGINGPILTPSKQFKDGALAEKKKNFRDKGEKDMKRYITIGIQIVVIIILLLALRGCITIPYVSPDLRCAGPVGMEPQNPQPFTPGMVPPNPAPNNPGPQVPPGSVGIPPQNPPVIGDPPQIPPAVVDHPKNPPIIADQVPPQGNPPGGKTDKGPTNTPTPMGRILVRVVPLHPASPTPTFNIQ